VNRNTEEIQLLKHLRVRFSKAVEKGRYAIMPRLTNWLLRASTYSARKALSIDTPLPILVDNSVLSHGVTHETAWISTGTQKWGNHEVETGYAARIPVHSMNHDSDAYRSIEHLPAIAYLARTGYLSLKTSAELLDEQFRQPTGRYHGYGYFDYSVFSDLTLPSVDGRVDIAVDSMSLTRSDSGQAQRARMANSDDARYHAFVAQLGEKKSQDAWHLRTCERHKMFCFLTMDLRLVNQVKRLANKEPFNSLATRVMTPEDLGTELGLLTIPPMLLSYTDASFIVRADLSWENGRRRGARNVKSNRDD
jgi:hypothetical protein